MTNAENKRSKGRPIQQKREKATHPLVVMLTEADHNRLEEYSNEMGAPMSTIVRIWIKKNLA